MSSHPQGSQGAADAAAERAMNATAPKRILFGQVIFTEWSDVGFTPEPVNRYEPFNPQKHSGAPRTRVQIEVEAFKRGGVWIAKQEYIDTHKKWYEITLPSLKKCGMGLTTLSKQWVKIEFRRTGRTWEDKNSGETRHEETFYFLERFADQAACEAAYVESLGYPSEDVQGAAASSNDQSSAPPSEDGGTMLRAASAMWNACNGDEDRFRTAIAANTMIMNHFGRDVDKIVAAVRPATAPASTNAAALPPGDRTDDAEDDDIPF